MESPPWVQHSIVHSLRHTRSSQSLPRALSSGCSFASVLSNPAAATISCWRARFLLYPGSEWLLLLLLFPVPTSSSTTSVWPRGPTPVYCELLATVLPERCMEGRWPTLVETGVTGIASASIAVRGADEACKVNCVRIARSGKVLGRVSILFFASGLVCRLRWRLK